MTDEKLDKMSEEDALDYCNDILSTVGICIVPVFGTGIHGIDRRYKLILSNGKHNSYYKSVKNAYYGAIKLVM